MKSGGGESLVRKPPRTCRVCPSPRVSRVCSSPARNSSTTSVAPARRARISAQRRASSAASATSETSSLATPSRGFTTHGNGTSSPAGSAPGGSSAARTASSPVRARCRRSWPLSLARSAARQSLAGSPKYSAASAVCVCRWSLLLNTASGEASWETVLITARKSRTSHSTSSTANSRSA